MEQPFEHDPDLEAQSILLAASLHDVVKLRTLLRGSSSNPANVQDPDTGYTPLHSAIAACEPEGTPTYAQKIGTGATPLPKNGPVGNGNTNSAAAGGHAAEELEAAAETMKLLLLNGAIWNDLDKNYETPGCLAKRLGLEQLYNIMVDAGVRAEMLLNRLDEYQQLEDEDADEDEDEYHADEVPDEQGQGTEPPSKNISTKLSPEPASTSRATPIQQGLITLGQEVNSADYLRSDLTFTADRLLDRDQNGVMMSWEAEIMKQSADGISPVSGLRILNIGHGMGIIDEMFQSKAPISHHIIEAHPAVIEKMKNNGWYEKPGVTVHPGKWQDIVPELIEDAVIFDAIYFDTFAEDFKDLRQFFDQYIIGLLEDNGKWSFFNGFGADRQVCYDVYAKVLEMDLLESGFDVDWTSLPVPDLDESRTWEGLKRPYWKLTEYKLPIVKFLT